MMKGLPEMNDVFIISNSNTNEKRGDNFNNK